MTHETTDQTFENDVLSNKGYVLVDFWAEWCRPCKQLSPIIDDIASDMEKDLKVYKVNIDQNPEMPAKYNVRGIPTLILFKEGKLVGTKVGSLPKSSIIEWIESVKASA